MAHRHFLVFTLLLALALPSALGEIETTSWSVRPCADTPLRQPGRAPPAYRRRLESSALALPCSPSLQAARSGSPQQLQEPDVCQAAPWLATQPAPRRC